MTGDEILDAMEHIDPDLIEAADVPMKKRRKPYWVAAVAAVLAVAVGIGMLLPGGTDAPIPRKPVLLDTVLDVPVPVAFPEGVQLTSMQSPASLGLANLVAGPEYSQMVLKPNENELDKKAYADAYNAYLDYQWDWAQNYDLTEDETQNLDYFFLHSSQEFLSGEGNQVYSPLNMYLALAMLAECTGGNSRQEILDLLGVSSIEVLCAQAQKIWYANYYTDGKNTSLLANSVWLDSQFTYQADTVQKLADNYFASVFHGDLGTDDMNEQLRTWLNSQTGNLLTEQTKKTKLSDKTAFALVSTLYYSVNWSQAFDADDNTDRTFYSANGNYTTEFMNRTYDTIYFRGRDYGAVAIGLDGYSTGYMWLILPDKGYSAEYILQNRNWLDASGWKAIDNAEVTLSLPKFDISSQSDLVEGMKSLGINDIFDDHVSDFSPICASHPLYVNKIDHAVRVGIDEEGVTGAAYTVIELTYKGTGTQIKKKIDFILDRPFLFVITSSDGLPLFTGIVNEP